MITLSKDFEDLLVSLADAEADFLLVGGYAVAFHGHSRATKDIDVLVRPTRENAAKVFSALRAFGAPLTSLDVGEDDLPNYGGVIQFGMPPNRIDILMHFSGVTFDEAKTGDSQFEMKGRTLKVIGLDALVKKKRAAGRSQDMLDVEALEKNRQ